jgi:hypothetical protein
MPSERQVFSGRRSPECIAEFACGKAAWLFEAENQLADAHDRTVDASIPRRAQEGVSEGVS